MPEHENLSRRIEESRQQLYALEQEYGLTHASVLKQSMVLDELINEYNRKFYARTKSRFTGSSQFLREELLPGHSYLYCSPFAVTLS
ncbi:aspartyl-phosphate phosphatase Spo0E family protein [Paenibacillus sp. P96]|uniref:Aspartyl-phosphate phosphatase Spo0E family protein n=1 Tax=Paenibacillus zeirhizosphaerae TaxID=2987519 RepID=A0ABT9FXA9_9BACL|nr:aspartyl-phosphate phosphatase Spo0E family protein [Paenibacillus sp. P96]MDP4099102.1 aspartyl-phosphate phosphatase Spo0E family protein [Paenibacillus sp. P96]